MSGLTDNPLGGTTLRVYRYLYKTGKPLGIHDVQRGLGLSSASVAEYHLKKLLRDGLIREEGGGYVVDRVVFENMVRLGRWVLPFQSAYAAFFATTLIMMVTIFRPAVLTSSYVFAVAVNLAALGFSLYETWRAARLVYRD
jgi:DNA-binding transcriptional ArsR family regulator